MRYRVSIELFVQYRRAQPWLELIQRNENKRDRADLSLLFLVFGRGEMHNAPGSRCLAEGLIIPKGYPHIFLKGDFL
jgi:hypothetical protein